MGRLEKQVMFSLSQTRATSTPALWWKRDRTDAISLSFPPTTLLARGSGLRCCAGGWMSHDTVSLLKPCSQIHPSKGLPTSRIGKNFQASEFLELVQQEGRAKFFEVFQKKVEVKTIMERRGMPPQDSTYFISMDSTPAVSANALFILRLLAWYLSFLDSTIFLIFQKFQESKRNSCIIQK